MTLHRKLQKILVVILLLLVMFVNTENVGAQSTPTDQAKNTIKISKQEAIARAQAAVNRANADFEKAAQRLQYANDLWTGCKNDWGVFAYKTCEGKLADAKRAQADIQNTAIPALDNAKNKLQQIQNSPDDADFNNLVGQVESSAKVVNDAAKEKTNQGIGSSFGSANCNPISPAFSIAYCINYGLAWISYGVLSLCAWLLGLAGLLFDNVLKYTVVNMAENIGKVSTIGTMWVMLRDVINIAFIFILLYIAIRTILSMDSGVDKDVKRFIRDVIIAAILVNFSLFFTKVVIDASNILALGFYRQTIPAGQELTTSSFSNQFVEPLGITSIYSGGSNAGNFVEGLASQGFWQIVIMGVGGSIFLIMIAFTFIYATVLFLIRYVVLIFLMIFSGIAFMSFILPATKKHGEKWRQTLIGQSIFAPLYLFMIYFVLRVTQQLFLSSTAGESFGKALTPTPQDVKNLGEVVTEPILKFLIVIGLLNVATHLAKSFATQGSSLAEGAVRWGTGKVDRLRTGLQNRAINTGKAAAGAATLGTAGLVLRNTVGRFGNKLSDKDTAVGNALNRAALEGGFIKRNLAKATLAVTKKAATGSFDARTTAAGASLGLGSAAGVGGYEANIEAKAKKVQEEIEMYGGGTKGTQKEIKTARKAVAAARKKYRKSKTDDERKAAMIEMKNAAVSLGRLEGKKKGEVADQQLRYMTYVGTPRWFRPFTSRQNKRAMDQFLKKVRPSKDESLDAIAKVKGEEILQAHNSGRSVKPILDQMTDKQIGKMLGSVFVEDVAGSLVARNEIIKYLKPSHLTAMKDELTSGEKAEIRRAITAMVTAGGATQETIASNNYLTSPPGQSW